MSIFDRLIINSLKKAVKELPKENELYRSLYPLNYGVYTQDGNEDDPLDYGFNVNSTVWAIVNRISRAAAKVPLVVQQWNKADRAWETLDDHELYDIFEKPNERQAKTEFLQEGYAFKLVTGNNYIYSPISDFGKNTITHMYNMPSPKVEIVPGSHYLDPIKGFQIDDTYYGGKSVISKEKVLHLKNLNLDYNNGSELYGKSALQVGIETLKKDRQRTIRMNKNYENSGANGLVYRDSSSAARLTPEQQTIINRKMRNDIINNAGGVTVLQEKYGYINLGISPADMEMIEDAKFSLRDICNLYNAPAILFGDDSNSKYNHMVEAKKDLYLNAAIPEVETRCDEFNRQWSHLYGDNIRIWYDKSNIEELQTDKKQLMEWANIAPLTINERRALVEFDPLEGDQGDVILTQTGQMPLEMLSAANALQSLQMREEPS